MSIPILTLPFLAFSAIAASPPSTTYNCQVTIVGGGMAGMHSLYRLAPALKNSSSGLSSLCLFEINDYFGGRVKSIPSPNGAGVFDTGAMRVQETQNLEFNLAKELGFDLSEQTGNYVVPYGPQRVFARGAQYEDVNNYLLNATNLLTGTKSLKLYDTPTPNKQFPDKASTYPVAGAGYPDVSTAWNCQGMGNYNGCFSDAYYHSLLNPGYLPAPLAYSDNRTWLENVLKPEGFQYLADSFRFRGDFENGVDPRSYVDFLKEDWDACCSPTYPKNGMSAFIYGTPDQNGSNGMLAKAKANGARTFLSEGIATIDKISNNNSKCANPGGKNNGKYCLVTTKNNLVIADSVIIAVPPVGLKNIGGGIANTIKQDAKFQALVPVEVVSINHWWNTPWWENTRTADGTSTIARSWSTKNAIPSDTLYFNFLEFGHSDYQKMQLATRSVYSDDKVSNQHWKQLKVGTDPTSGVDAINAEIVREFNVIFPELNGTISTSQITKTYFIVWPDAWYWLKGPTTLTNADITKWALEPIPGEKISLASDAYNPSRTTWIDGAMKSSVNTLNYNYSNLADTNTNFNAHNARINAYINPLPCNSVVVTNGQPVYVPFNKDGVFNANCPLQ